MRVTTDEEDRKIAGSEASGLTSINAHQVQALESEHLHQSAPLVSPRGDGVEKGAGLADGPATTTANLRWARTSWSPSCPGVATTSRTPFWFPSGWSRMTSLHLHPHRGTDLSVARDTKLGPEEITCDIPNVGEEAHWPRTSTNRGSSTDRR